MTPDKFTLQELMLDVGDGHQLYIQDWGKADAETPIILLHGGPGNGSDNRDRKKFDPKTQRVIFYDQRGAGKSLPYGSLEHNTTPALIEDIERIADRLGIKKFILAGGSWGSCLALAYAVSNPERVAAMVLYGVFTGGKDDIAWLDKGGYRDFFPEVWREYSESVPKQYRDDPTVFHLKQALGKDPVAAKRSAYAYQTMELAILKLDDRFTPDDYETYDPTLISMEMHYIANRCFMEDGYILNNATSLTMPITLVHGRYDMVCRPAGVERLHRALPNSQLIWTINGHLNQHEANTVLALLLQQASEAKA